MATPTNTSTMVAFIAELIEDHIEHCDPDIPHVLSETHGTKASIESLSSAEHRLTLTLDDGTQFGITFLRIA